MRQIVAARCSSSSRGDPYAVRSLRAQRYVDRTLLGASPTVKASHRAVRIGLAAALRERPAADQVGGLLGDHSVGAFVFPRVIVGITEASTTRRPSKP